MAAFQTTVIVWWIRFKPVRRFRMVCVHPKDNKKAEFFNSAF